MVRYFCGQVSWGGGIQYSLDLVVVGALPRVLPGGLGKWLLRWSITRLGPHPLYYSKIRKVEHRTILNLLEDLLEVHSMGEG